MATKMKEVLLKEQIEQMQTELRNLRVKDSAPVLQQTKDLSLVGLIPKWSWSDKAVSVKDFFDTEESNAGIGNWSDTDILIYPQQSCVLLKKYLFQFCLL